VLDDVGLGYLRLGQSATTLSGGEAQRVKLAAHLAQSTSEGTLYIFDEPTTGLHFDDIAKLLDAFERLLRSGASILIIEHNLEVIRRADWVIDLGPEGGDRGGRIVAEGTPEQIAEVPGSYTGKYLKAAFSAEQERALNPTR
jgi:excinuclease ABC subunit A